MDNNKDCTECRILDKDFSTENQLSWKSKARCWFERFSARITCWAGSPLSFILAFGGLLLWGAVGPLFHYSDTWQLVINTGTSIVTFLMVFLIQQSQNKDSMALHIKLDELIYSNKSANNKLLGMENSTAEDLQKLARFYYEMAEKAAKLKEIKTENG